MCAGSELTAGSRMAQSLVWMSPSLIFHAAMHLPNPSLSSCNCLCTLFCFSVFLDGTILGRNDLVTLLFPALYCDISYSKPESVK